MGYTADTTFLDGDLGFWRFFGGDSWDPEVLTEKFGREWKMLKALEFKPYPCCRDFHVPLDCFIKIINENKLMAGEVERVRIQTHPLVTGSFYTNKVIKDHITAQFSLPYVIAVAANRVNLPEWQDPGTLKDPQILNFMDKVFIEAHPNFIEVQLKEPLSNMTIVEVITKNRTFKEEGKYTKGLPEPEFSRMSDEELVEKFKLNVSKVLPQYKISKAIENITVLENVKNISEVVEQVTL
jgi:2-methylcitrate dehydratase PrpD